MKNIYSKTNIIELSDKDFNNKLLVSDKFKNKNGLIKFYAPWCPHCKDMKSDLIFLSNNLSKYGFIIGVINTDHNKDLVDKFNISGIPKLFLVDTKGNLKSLDTEDNSIENLLKNICKFTKRCCKKQNNKIICEN
uniref:Thioredoxin domain-containing protein n=1 Tax=viral metagenome TaxID=1070528 RepID=A0A6C0IX98_9ZZZZ